MSDISKAADEIVGAIEAASQSICDALDSVCADLCSHIFDVSEAIHMFRGKVPLPEPETLPE